MFVGWGFGGWVGGVGGGAINLLNLLNPEPSSRRDGFSFFE